jgi:hypothetical protein
VTVAAVIDNLDLGFVSADKAQDPSEYAQHVWSKVRFGAESIKPGVSASMNTATLSVV